MVDSYESWTTRGGGPIRETIRRLKPARSLDGVEFALDADDMEIRAVQGQTPATVLLIEVREVFMQCQRAILRSRVWGERAKPQDLPSAGELLAAHTGGLVDAAAYDAEAAPRVGATLY